MPYNDFLKWALGGGFNEQRYRPPQGDPIMGAQESNPYNVDRPNQTGLEAPLLDILLKTFGVAAAKGFGSEMGKGVGQMAFGQAQPIQFPEANRTGFGPIADPNLAGFKLPFNKALQPSRSLAQGGVINNPVVGVDQVTGETVSIAENEPEYVLTKDQIAQLAQGSFGNPYNVDRPNQQGVAPEVFGPPQPQAPVSTEKPFDWGNAVSLAGRAFGYYMTAEMKNKGIDATSPVEAMYEYFDAVEAKAGEFKTKIKLKEKEAELDIQKTAAKSVIKQAEPKYQIETIKTSAEAQQTVQENLGTMPEPPKDKAARGQKSRENAQKFLGSKEGAAAYGKVSDLAEGEYNKLLEMIAAYNVGDTQMIPKMSHPWQLAPWTKNDFVVNYKSFQKEQAEKKGIKPKGYTLSEDKIDKRNGNEYKAGQYVTAELHANLISKNKKGR